MSAVTFIFHRYDDPSGVSGVGVVAEGCEFSDGAVAVRWPGKHPSTATWNDIRDAEAIHGHGGKTVVQYVDAPRLVRAYERVVPWLLNSRATDLPFMCAPHPDHPDRLRLIFKASGVWRFWVALLEGSTDASTHVEMDGEIAHTWISPDGDLWLQYFTRIPNDSEGPLAIFDKEDR